MSSFELTLRKISAEFIGTFAVVFVTCGALLLTGSTSIENQFSIAPLLAGLTLSAMIVAVGAISGAHLNPIVSIGFSLSRGQAWHITGLYCLAHFAAAFFAVAILFYSLPNVAIEYAVTIPHLETATVLLWEFLLSMLLVFTYLSTATDTRAIGINAAIGVGFIFTTGLYLATPISGGSLNPARSFATALFAKNFSGLWIYFIACPIGGIIAAWIFNIIKNPRGRRTSDHETLNAQHISPDFRIRRSKGRRDGDFPAPPADNRRTPTTDNKE